MQEDLLLTREAAQRRGVSERTIQRWVKQKERPLPMREASGADLQNLLEAGRLKAVPPHKLYLIRVSDLDAYVPPQSGRPRHHG